MTKFVCFAKDCPNEAVVYDFGDENPTICECGGCKTFLSPVVEESADE